MSITHWDVIIVGTGAGGGTLAQRLAQTGKRILLLERGEFLPREPENWQEDEVVVRGRYRAREQWLDGSGQRIDPFTHFWVGGNTKLYGAALFRLREHDFQRVPHFDGESPAWPLAYADFEPYYARAERLYQVHGTAGSDPCEPPALARTITQRSRTSRASASSPARCARPGCIRFRSRSACASRPTWRAARPSRSAPSTASPTPPRPRPTRTWSAWRAPSPTPTSHCAPVRWWSGS